MTAAQYEKWTRPFRTHARLTAILLMANRILTGLCYVMYPLLLLILFVRKDSLLPRAFFTAGISFVIVSVFRRIYNRQRPYEALGIEPLIVRDTKGKSFPSRHVFSVFVIAMCYFAYWKPLGIALLVVGVFMAFIRVLGGVHYPIDVVVGAVVGIASGVIGLYVI